MAFILKRPTVQSPGIIVFTHKELPFFTRADSGLAGDIEMLRKQFVLSMHWGHFASDVVPPTQIDFHLAGRGTLFFRDGCSARRLEFCSRNFVPGVFRPDGGVKYWDILTVGRPLRLKNFDQFFIVIKDILSKRPSTTVLAICPEIPNQNAKYDYVEMVRDYEFLFTEQERKNVTLLLLSDQMYPFPLGQDVMAFFYNRSRTFTLFSEQEGESRVIAEALLCGLPVFARKELRGGGQDFLDQSNSIQFGSLEEAAASFAGVLDGTIVRHVDVTKLAAELRADYSVPRFKSEIAAVLGQLGHVLDGGMDTDNLDRKLPGHFKLLPAAIRSEMTDDIRDERAFRLFVRFASGQWIEQKEAPKKPSFAQSVSAPLPKRWLQYVWRNCLKRIRR